MINIGVTLWEIFTFGRRPFEKIHTRHLIHHLEKGLRLAQPLTTSLELYQLMVECEFAICFGYFNL